MKIKVPTTKELFDAGVHLGHQTRRWHPKAEPFIYEARKNIHVINLEITHENLKEAAEFLFNTAKKGEEVIFLGTKRQVSDLIKIEAEHCNALYVNERWLGGTLTNFRVVKKNIDRLVSMKKKREEGEYDMYTKKEQLLLDREINKLERSVGGLVGMKGLPGALVVIDALREKTAVREAKKLDVPIVALIDTDTDPTGIDYPIPGNDDAIKSTSLILKVLSNAVEKGYEAHAKAAKAAKKEEEEKKRKEKQEEEERARLEAKKKAKEEAKEAKAKNKEAKEEAESVSKEKEAANKKSSKGSSSKESTKKDSTEKKKKKE